MQTNIPHDSVSGGVRIEKLEEFLKRELAAVETYELVLKNVDHGEIRHTLQGLLINHTRRADRIRERIEMLGAVPPKSSGVWGTLAKAVQAGADLLGDRTAIAVLEEGEDRGLKFYTENLSECDVKTRRFIETELLPEQQWTHNQCRSLKRQINKPS